MLIYTDAVYTDWCWLMLFMLIDADWCWLMLIDADWCRLMLIDADWGWLMPIDAGWCWLICWLMLIDAQIRFNPVFFCRSVPPELLRSFFDWCLQRANPWKKNIKDVCEMFCSNSWATTYSHGICPWPVSLSWAEFAFRSQIGNWTLAKVNSGMEWSLSLRPFLWALTAYQARNASSCGIPQTPKGPYGILWNPKKGPKSMKSAGFHSFTTGLPE